MESFSQLASPPRGRITAEFQAKSQAIASSDDGSAIDPRDTNVAVGSSDEDSDDGLITLPLPLHRTPSRRVSPYVEIVQPSRKVNSPQNVWRISEQAPDPASVASPKKISPPADQRLSLSPSYPQRETVTAE